MVVCRSDTKSAGAVVAVAAATASGSGGSKSSGGSGDEPMRWLRAFRAMTERVGVEHVPHYRRLHVFWTRMDKWLTVSAPHIRERLQPPISSAEMKLQKQNLDTRMIRSHRALMTALISNAAAADSKLSAAETKSAVQRLQSLPATTDPRLPPEVVCSLKAFHNGQIGLGSGIANEDERESVVMTDAHSGVFGGFEFYNSHYNYQLLSWSEIQSTVADWQSAKWNAIAGRRPDLPSSFDDCVPISESFGQWGAFAIDTKHGSPVWQH